MLRSRRWIFVLLVVLGLLSAVVGVFRFVGNEAAEATAAVNYEQRREEIAAYAKAAEIVHEKISRYVDRSVAPYSPRQVSDLGEGRYKVEVPYQGFAADGSDKTLVSTCLVHCDRGLCYVDHTDLK